MIENIQIINVATAQVEKPLISIPSVKAWVSSKPTKVVTSAIPPIRYGAFFMASFIMKGPRITVTNVKKRTATKNESPSIEKFLRAMPATKSPIAFAITDNNV